MFLLEKIQLVPKACDDLKKSKTREILTRFSNLARSTWIASSRRLFCSVRTDCTRARGAVELAGECLNCSFRLTRDWPTLVVYVIGTTVGAYPRGRYSRLQLRWFRPKPGARRLLRYAHAASRESWQISTRQDWLQPLQAPVNPNFTAGSRIRNLLHQTLSASHRQRWESWLLD